MLMFRHPVRFRCALEPAVSAVYWCVPADEQTLVPLPRVNPVS